MSFLEHHFTFGNKDSNDYKLIVANLDVERPRMLEGAYATNNFFNRAESRNYFVGNDYSSSQLSFEIEMITEDQSPIPLSQQREIEQWLFSYQGYRKFLVEKNEAIEYEHFTIEDGEELHFYLNAMLTDGSRIETGCDVIGYRALLTADSSMMWQEESSVTEDFGETGATTNSMTVNVNTDRAGYTYPIITIRTDSDAQTIRLVNTKADPSRVHWINVTSPGANITIDSNVGYTSASYNSFSHSGFPVLIGGENTLTLDGSGIVSCTVRWKNQRFL